VSTTHAHRGAIRALVATLALLALLPVASAGAAKRQVPVGFMGVHADGPVVDPSVDLDAQVGAMAENGVETLRAAFHWSEMQPYASPADVPADQKDRFARTVDGVPTDFGLSDRVVAAASAHGIRVLPVVVRTPPWAAKDAFDGASPPTSPKTYARFMRGLVLRYGPNGDFARERPGELTLPVRSWQVWNEPNALYYWSEQPFAAGYVRLLKAAATAIRKADPGAQVVLAGLVNQSWRHIAKIYKAGGRRFFDVAAIHPFTREPRNVVRILRLVRDAMAAGGDRKKHMMITELTYASAEGKRVNRSFGIEVTEKEQAERLREVFLLLAARRRELLLDRVFWLSWLRQDKSRDDVFDYSGLRSIGPDGAIRDKPALGAYRTVARRLEGCAKTATAGCR